jgi:D-proline reductase (dithiol) PrdB
MGRLCNQSVGLIQRSIEAAGISTVSISLVQEITVQVRPSRALFLRWPFGHPLGGPFTVPQHLRILRDMLYALESIQEPGTIIDLGYRWRRERYEDSA